MPPAESTFEGRKLDAMLPRLRAVVDEVSDLIIEHRHYRGGRAPTRFVCSDFLALERYVAKSARAGDTFVVWQFEHCCSDDNVFDSAKQPDALGRVPSGGAY